VKNARACQARASCHCDIGSKQVVTMRNPAE
jgi:hypothetical protein